MNGELQIINVKKTKFSIFHNASGRDDLPLTLPRLFINNQVIKRQSSIPKHPNG